MTLNTGQEWIEDFENGGVVTDIENHGWTRVGAASGSLVTSTANRLRYVRGNANPFAYTKSVSTINHWVEADIFWGSTAATRPVSSFSLGVRYTGATDTDGISIRFNSGGNTYKVCIGSDQPAYRPGTVIGYNSNVDPGGTSYRVHIGVIADRVFVGHRLQTATDWTWIHPEGGFVIPQTLIDSKPAILTSQTVFIGNLLGNQSTSENFLDNFTAGEQFYIAEIVDPRSSTRTGVVNAIQVLPSFVDVYRAPSDQVYAITGNTIASSVYGGARRTTGGFASGPTYDGDSWVFNGSQCVSYNDGLHVTFPFSMEMEFNVTNAVTTYLFNLGQGNGLGWPEFVIGYNANGSIYTQISSADSGANQQTDFVLPAGTIIPGLWYSLSIQLFLVGTTRTMEVYLNGVKKFTGTVPIPWNATAGLTIAGDNTPANRFQGKIRRVLITRTNRMYPPLRSTERIDTVSAAFVPAKLLDVYKADPSEVYTVVNGTIANTVYTATRRTGAGYPAPSLDGDQFVFTGSQRISYTDGIRITPPFSVEMDFNITSDITGCLFNFGQGFQLGYPEFIAVYLSGGIYVQMATSNTDSGVNTYLAVPYGTIEVGTWYTFGIQFYVNDDGELTLEAFLNNQRTYIGEAIQPYDSTAGFSIGSSNSGDNIIRGRIRRFIVSRSKMWPAFFSKTRIDSVGRVDGVWSEDFSSETATALVDLGFRFDTTEIEALPRSAIVGTQHALTFTSGDLAPSTWTKSATAVDHYIQCDILSIPNQAYQFPAIIRMYSPEHFIGLMFDNNQMVVMARYEGQNHEYIRTSIPALPFRFGMSTFSDSVFFNTAPAGVDPLNSGTGPGYSFFIDESMPELLLSDRTGMARLTEIQNQNIADNYLSGYYILMDVSVNIRHPRSETRIDDGIISLTVGRMRSATFIDEVSPSISLRSLTRTDEVFATVDIIYAFQLNRSLTATDIPFTPTNIVYAFEPNRSLTRIDHALGTGTIQISDTRSLTRTDLVTGFTDTIGINTPRSATRTDTVFATVDIIGSFEINRSETRIDEMPPADRSIIDIKTPRSKTKIDTVTIFAFVAIVNDLRSTTRTDVAPVGVTFFANVIDLRSETYANSFRTETGNYRPYLFM